MHFLGSVMNTPFPELAFVDKNDDQWKLSNLDAKTFSLPDDGSLMQTSISDFTFMKIARPKTVSPADLNANPKILMDLILKGIKMERSLGSSGKYRILSYGEPESVTEYKDSLDRLWLRARWLLAYEDAYLIAYILPTPSGPVVIMTKLPTANISVAWDIDAICDHIQAAYRGDFDEWKEFLTQPKWVPSFLSGLSFEWNEKAGLSLRCPDVLLNAGSDVFEWTSKSTLFLAPAYYLQEKNIEYGIRKIVIQRDIRGRDYAVLYKNIKPDSRLGEKSEASWADILAAKYPFDEIPRLSSKDNTGFAGALLPLEHPSDDIRYSLYLAMENPGSEENIKNRLTALKAGISAEK
jgi:hypothetical protein